MNSYSIWFRLRCWKIQVHGPNEPQQTKKSIPNEFETLTVAATRKCNANLRISCVAWPTSHATPRDWDGWSPSWSEMCPPKIVGPPCAWNRNPWKSQTMSIWFGHVSHVFWKKNDKISAFSAGFVGIPKPWWKNCHTSLQEGRTPKAKAKPIPHGVGFEFGICRISKQIHLN